MLKVFWGIVAVLLLPIQPASAQQAAAPTVKVGVLSAPCADQSPMPPQEVAAYMVSVVKARSANLPIPDPTADVAASYKAWNDARVLQDFGGLCRYHDANAKLTAATSRRVVFFGDSITELWGGGDPALFTGDVINRGIGGQTTSQMVVRFQEDVIALHPRVVHILAGTNDIAGNTGPTTLPWIEANIRTMVELAKAHHIKIVLAAVLPAERYDWQPKLDPVPTIGALNAWLRTYAKVEGLVFIDYSAPLENERHGLKAEFSEDGVHPNAAGYAIMRPLVKRALHQALGQSRR